MEREITLDTETTGLDPAQGHRVVEIGCVEMHGRVRSGRSFHCYLNPDRDMPEEAFRIHGLSAEFLSGKQRFADICDEFLSFIDGATLVIHNAIFDVKFLNAELEKIGRAAIDCTRVIDTVPLARKKYPGAPASLDALCRRYAIDLSARTKHGALLDAELLAEVYLELMGGRQAALDLSVAQGVGVATMSTGAAICTLSSLPAREFALSDEEIAAHNSLTSRLKNAIWKKIAQDHVA